MEIQDSNIQKEKKTDIKQIVYTICFISVAFIDWIRGSQGGLEWSIAVNSIGFIMMILFFMQFSWKHEVRKPYVVWFFLYNFYIERRA